MRRFGLGDSGSNGVSRPSCRSQGCSHVTPLKIQGWRRSGAVRDCVKSQFLEKCDLTKSTTCTAHTLQKQGFHTVWCFVRPATATELAHRVAPHSCSG